jgi:type II protein arginine methyltransferase
MNDDVHGAGLVDVERVGLQPAPVPDVAEFIRRGRALHGAGRYEEAVRAYQLVLDSERHNWQALVGQNRAIRQCVPRWHWEMLHDEQRADLYDQAIRKVVTPGHLVLDVGTGSGLLAMMAARAGAGQVIACEGQPSVADVATRVIRNAGYDQAVTVLPKMSTRMQVPADLPRRADVLVTETVDCGLLGEGILTTIAHAREHLLTEDAIIMPGRARVLAQLVESVPLHRKNHVGELYGFDFSEFNRLSSMEYFDSRLQRHEHRMLSEPLEVFRFDFYRDGPTARRADFVVNPATAGTCHAIVFWFEMELLPGIELTNSPDHPNTHWKQAVQCLPVPVSVRPGEPLLLEARHDELNVHFTAVGTGDRTSRNGAAR